MWSYILTAIGLLGFYFVGKKAWWAWYINIANQFLWLTYALVTEQYGFIIGSVFYFIVFAKNAYAWTKDRHKDPILEELKLGIITVNEARARHNLPPRNDYDA